MIVLVELVLKIVLYLQLVVNLLQFYVLMELAHQEEKTVLKSSKNVMPKNQSDVKIDNATKIDLNVQKLEVVHKDYSDVMTDLAYQILRVVWLHNAHHIWAINVLMDSVSPTKNYVTNQMDVHTTENSNAPLEDVLLILINAIKLCKLILL